MGVKTILDVTVKEVEKRRFPTKHYVSLLVSGLRLYTFDTDFLP